MEQKILKKSLITIDRLIILVIVLLLMAISGSIYFYRQSGVNPQQEKQSELTGVLEALGQLIVLPKNEIPMMTTINDLEKLKGQLFFVNAKIGDKVLIFETSKKAILFDPAANKIVEVAPINSELPR